MVYCPNLEQVRGRKPDHPWGDVAKNAPDWAVIDDPFHKGCKGFDIDGYVEYIVAYVRANRNRIVQVVPSDPTTSRSHSAVLEVFACTTLARPSEVHR